MMIYVKCIAISALLAFAVGLSMPAFAQNSNLPDVPSLVGTSWNVAETDGDNDVFTFVADGTLHYFDGKKNYENGTWKQDGDSIYIEMNNKYCQYQGRISGMHMEGRAWNVTGKNWTWVADQR
ncbi:MAG: hypothetical protein ABSF16_00075 [Terracidiphilus sp.]|jgi:hypothetical protein